MVVRQCDNVIISDIDKNLSGPKMYLCVKFVGGIGGPDSNTY